MSSCEKCWIDAQLLGMQYSKFVNSRPPCTPEQQAGPDAGECPVCHRKTLHQHTREPMCGCGAPTLSSGTALAEVSETAEAGHSHEPTPRPRGRPRLAAQRGIVVNVSLPRELVERLRVVGNGSISRGILRLLVPSDP
jgi:hypothetical protein